MKYTGRMSNSAKQPTWILQENAIGSADLKRMSRCIERQGMRVEFVRVVPFSHELVGKPPIISGRSICYGSSGLLRAARQSRWQPGGWDGERFSLQWTNNAVGRLSLNRDADFVPWSQTVELAEQKGWDRLFVRPSAESKEFPGRVLNFAEFRSWWEGLQRIDYFKDNDALACIGPCRELGREWRFFVVGSRPIAASQYAVDGAPSSTPGAPAEAHAFVEQILGLFQPAPCFVIDIAEVFDESGCDFAVVEFNSINSAGFYQADLEEIIRSLGAYVSNTPADS